LRTTKKSLKKLTSANFKACIPNPKSMKRNLNHRLKRSLLRKRRKLKLLKAKTVLTASHKSGLNLSLSLYLSLYLYLNLNLNNKCLFTRTRRPKRLPKTLRLSKCSANNKY